MSEGDSSSFSVARDAWSDVFLALRAMTLVFIITMALSALQKLLESYFAHPDDPSQVPIATAFLVSLVSVMADAFVNTPLEIAMQRFVLFGETNSSYRPTGADRRSSRFWFYSVVIAAPGALAGQILQLLKKSPDHAFLIFVFSVIMLWAFVYIYTRFAFLFPAIASDSPFGRPAVAYRLSFGHFWRIFIVGILTSLPTLFLSIGFGILASAANGWQRPETSQLSLFTWLMVPIGVAQTAALAAAMARVYREAASDPEVNPR